MAELAASIQTQGVLQPLLVRASPEDPTVYQIVAGERRWRAAQLAGLSEVPCTIRAWDDAQAAAVALVENLQRVDLDAIDEASGLQRLIDAYGLTQEDAADAIGKSRSHVANTLRLLRLPDTVKTFVRDGKLSAGHARALLTHPDPAAAAEAVLKEGLSVRATESLTNQALAKPKVSASVPRPEPIVDPDVAALEQRLSAKWGLPIHVSSRQGRGRLTINFSTLDQLDAILQKLDS